MNKAITAVAAFAIGATVGFFAAKKFFEEKYAQLAQEEIDSVKEIFGRDFKEKEKLIAKAKDIADNTPFGITTAKLSSDEGTNPNGVMARSSLNIQSKSEAAKQNYNLSPSKKTEAADEPPEDEESEEDDEDGPEGYPVKDDETERDLEDVDRTEPYLISDREYSEEFPEHDKISLYYYTFDDVLCNENEEPMDDLDSTVGQDAMSELANGAMTVWVRNEPLSIDYEICAVRNSYAQAVHGINLNENLSPRERYLRQQKRRENGDE